MASRIIRAAFAALIIAALSACDSEGRVRPEQTFMRVVHAAPSFEVIDFKRVSDIVATLQFGDGQSASFDSGPYNFNVDVVEFGGASILRAASLPLTLNPNELTTFILAESAGSVDPIVVTQTPFDESAADAEIMLVNAASNVGSVDAYVEVAGTDPATVTPLESNIGFGTVGTPTVRDAAGYRVILTTPGNPADVVFESATFTVPAGRSAVLVLTNGIGISDTLLLVLGQAAGIIPAANAQAAVRVINAAADAPTRDIYLDDDFSAPFVPAAAFGSVSDYQIQTPTTHEFIVTPAGNMSVEELRAAPELSADRYQTLWITGNSTDGLAARLSIDDLRPISAAAGLVIANGATSFLGIEFFVTSPGVDIAEVAPTAQLFAGDVNARINLPPGELELTLRDPVSQTIVAGPLPITVAAEGVYGLLAVEAVGGSTVDIVFFDDFN